MATSNKVFVSPGVYTSERDLQFVAQSVGVTTLGIAGETLKGPAFEPIFVTNYDEFQAYFGGTSPEKFVNTQIPKYEAAYIAKAYLQQSNQLFVTRILGLSGYDAGPSWSLTTIANVDCSTIEMTAGTGTYFTIDFSGNSGSSSSFVFSSIDPFISGSIDNVFTQFNGSTSSISDQIRTQLYQAILNGQAGGTLSASSIYYFGAIAAADIDANVGLGLDDVTNVYSVTSLSAESISYCNRLNDAWYFSIFQPQNDGSYYGVSFFTNINVGGFVDNGNGNYEGVVEGGYYEFSGNSFTEYNDIVVATLRSRGISEYYSSTQAGPQYQVSGTSDLIIDCGDATAGVTITSSPFAPFTLSGVQYNDVTFSFETSLNSVDTNFLPKVFGTYNFQKDRNDVPLFIEERYPVLLNYAWNQGFLRGLNCSLLALPEARNNNQTSIANYLERFQTAYSPWVVSELRGNTVYQLFRFITISDGDAANRQIKISVANMSYDNLTFDLFVRDFYDTDQNPTVYEKFTNCSMDPASNSYVAKKIGSPDGEYAIISKYVMIDVNEDAPSDALPCGFEGYVQRTYTGALPPFPVYKTHYEIPGETTKNPPFGLTSGQDDATVSSGDNIRRTYLGFSTSSNYGFDANMFDYKGKVTPTGWTCTETTYQSWNYLTKGFHMDSGASIVTISSVYSNSGDTAFEVGSGSFINEPVNPNDTYYRIYSRKFTLLPYGGFDGWDVYRERRTNDDSFILGKSGYLYGARENCDPYPNATGWGAFKQITVGDDTTNWANTDFYAYKLGIYTFDNPSIININVLTTPGIDYVNNYNLVKSAIDLVEIDRADSIYVTTTPDFDLLQPSASMENLIYPQDAVDALGDTGIDSNYTATYYPWVLTRDSGTNTQVYIPATAEVCRNLALTDNISFPWFATAGYTRGIVNSVRARKRLTQLDRDVLYQGRINPIASFNDVGTVIWGNKTLQLRESALDRINVRRLLLQARKLVSAVAVRLLFEQNDAVVRQQFLDSVNPILDAIRRDRGIYDFRVTVSSTPEELDSNQMSGKIYIKPTKALEFIDIEFVITPQGASFENI